MAVIQHNKGLLSKGRYCLHRFCCLVVSSFFLLFFRGTLSKALKIFIAIGMNVSSDDKKFVGALF